MDKRGKTIGNIVSDTLTLMDDMGLSMAASNNPQYLGRASVSPIPVSPIGYYLLFVILML